MLLILRSTARSCASTAASPVRDGPVTDVPPTGRADELPETAPVVTEPVEFAVPALLVPGGEAVFEALPAPLGSLSELLRPPALAGPEGTPLTLAVPAPAAPALGEPTALLLPAVGPLAAPAPPVPLAPPPVPLAPPPVPCANELSGDSVSRIAAIAAGLEIAVIENLRFDSNDKTSMLFRHGTNFAGGH
jgi:hypothetical protein